MDKTKLEIWAWIIAVLLFWASAFVGIRHALEAFSAENLAFLRYVAASLAFVVIAFFNKFKMPKRQDTPTFMLLGILGFVLYNLLLNYGEKTVNAGIASFIVNLSPFIATLFALILKNEHLSKNDWICLILSFIGISIIVFSKNTTLAFDFNAFLILGAAISQTLYFVIQKRLFERYSPLEITSYAVWFATIMLFFFSKNSLAEFRQADWQHKGSLIYLGIFPGAIAYLAVAVLLKKYKVSSVASYLFLIPFITLLLGFLTLNEVPSIISVLGGVLIILGILIKNDALKITKNKAFNQ
jgi:drug/metabolite transporter (DMT)-like permease